MLAIDKVRDYKKRSTNKLGSCRKGIARLVGYTRAVENLSLD